MLNKNIPTVSIAIAVFNEEANIAKCLNSVKNFVDEIILVDGSSNDKTVEIAKKFGAKVITTSNKVMFHVNKNLAIDSCSGGWILLLDADERVSQELAIEIRKKILTNPKENGFWINRANWLLGGFIKKGGAYPDRVIRLFRNGYGRLPEISVHEQVKVEGEVGFLNNDLTHFADPTFSRYLRRSDRYSSLSSLQLEQVNPGKGLFTILNYMFFKPIFTFVSIYFRHRGYADGFRGFIWAIFSSSQHYFSYSKYWQKKYGNKEIK